MKLIGKDLSWKIGELLNMMQKIREEFLVNKNPLREKFRISWQNIHPWIRSNKRHLSNKDIIDPQIQNFFNATVP